MDSMTRAIATERGGPWLRPIVTPEDFAGCRVPVYELVRGTADKGDFGQLLAAKGDKQGPRLLLSCTKAIASLGVDRAITAGRLKHLCGDVYEIKRRDLAIRAFCVVVGRGERVLVVDRVENTKGGSQGCYQRFISKTQNDFDTIERLANELQ